MVPPCTGHTQACEQHGAQHHQLWSPAENAHTHTQEPGEQGAFEEGVPASDGIVPNTTSHVQLHCGATLHQWSEQGHALALRGGGGVTPYQAEGWPDPQEHPFL